jgi:menaquinone-specific isochorismate synthase
MNASNFNLDLFLTYGAFVEHPHDKDTLMVGYGRPTFYKEPVEGSFYRNTFYLTKKKPFVLFEHTLQISKKNLASLLETKKIKKNNKAWSWTKPNASLYEKTFNSLYKRIEKGSLLKAVPYSLISSRRVVTTDDLPYLLKPLWEYTASTPTYAYGFWDPKEGFLGASPELLFHKENLMLTTHSVAGTLKKDDLKPSSFENEGPKIFHEQDFVTQYLKTILSDLGDVSLQERKVVNLQTLFHLKNEITVSLKKSYGFSELIKLIHPTPAVGNYPRRISDLKKWDPYDRFYYAAPFGYYENPHQFLALVGIRQVFWHSKEGRTKIFAGGGILKGSIRSHEWNEILLKFELIRKVFCL